MRLLDIVTVEEIMRSTDGTNPGEGTGKESCEDLRPLCKALARMTLQETLRRIQEDISASSGLRRAWLKAKRAALRNRWGARRAARDVPVMIAAMQMVDLALRKKWQAGGEAGTAASKSR